MFGKGDVLPTTQVNFMTRKKSPVLELQPQPVEVSKYIHVLYMYTCIHPYTCMLYNHVRTCTISACYISSMYYAVYSYTHSIHVSMYVYVYTCTIVCTCMLAPSMYLWISTILTYHKCIYIYIYIYMYVYICILNVWNAT